MLNKTYEDVKNFIEVESESGCKLKSKEYLGAKKKLQLECKCGKPFEKSFLDFGKKASRRMCKDCMKALNLTGKNRANKYEDVKHFIEVESDSGCKLKSKEYTKNSKKLDVDCKCGKPFNPSYTSFLKGQRQCHDCSNILYPSSLKHTYKEVKIIVESRGVELISKEYLRNCDKLTVKDKEGYYYFASLSAIQTSAFTTKVHKSNPYSTQNIKLWCKINGRPFELLDGQIYINGNINLKWKCLKDGEVFELTWNIVSNSSKKQGCPYCTKLKVCLSNCLATLRPDIAKEWHPTKNGDLTPYDITDINSKDQIWWQCDKGHEWQIDAGQRTYFNSACPYCTHKLPSEDYNLLVINPKLCEEEWNYAKNDKRPEECCPGSNQYAWWICKECGHDWEARINHRNNDGGCPECLVGWGEKRLKAIINEYALPNIPQLKFDDCRDKLPLPFDLGVFTDDTKTNVRIICEYDGKQHYEPVNFGGMSDERALEVFKNTQYHDLIKNNYCIANKIPLLRIPYWDRLIIEEILFDVFINGNMDSKYFVR